MIIGVLSDTHSLILPPKMLSAFAHVDLIIHAGDVCDNHTLKLLEAIKPVKAVQGNMCDLSLKKKLPVKLVLELEGVRIGVTHGHVGQLRDAKANALDQFKDDNVDLIIYGHSHKALVETVGRQKVFNPGSPNDVIKADFFSYGMIEIKHGNIKIDIIKL